MKIQLSAPLSGLRIRLAFLYSILLFGLASLGVGVIYLSLSVSLSDEPMSRDVAFQILGDELSELSDATNEDEDSFNQMERNQTQLVGFEQAVNQRALDQLRSYSGWSLLALFTTSMLIGWYVSGLVLRPIGKITAVARDIQATDLSRRIELVAQWIDQGASWPDGLELRPRKKIIKGEDERRIVESIFNKIMAAHKKTAEKAMKPYKNRITETLVDYEMVPIKGGTFLMGSPEGEKGRNKDEGPQRKVKVSPFWMGKHEIGRAHV